MKTTFSAILSSQCAPCSSPKSRILHTWNWACKHSFESFCELSFPELKSEVVKYEKTAIMAAVHFQCLILNVHLNAGLFVVEIEVLSIKCAYDPPSNAYSRDLIQNEVTRIHSYTRTHGPNILDARRSPADAQLREQASNFWWSHLCQARRAAMHCPTPPIKKTGEYKTKSANNRQGQRKADRTSVDILTECGISI